MQEKLIDGYPFIAYQHEIYSEHEMLVRSKVFYDWIDKRRTVRDFSDRPVPQEVIENLILSASTAPSGAHKQPWTFCVVKDPAIKKQIRDAAEQEEFESYNGRMTPDWLEDLRPLQTDWKKPFLETAPYLIIVFRRAYEKQQDGSSRSNYYTQESVGLACGFLLAAIHNAGLVALTHTPSPMNFLTKILNRPDNERPFILMPVGYPTDECYVPKLTRKHLHQMSVWY